MRRVAQSQETVISVKILKISLLAPLVAALFAVPFVSGCGGGDDGGGSSTSGTTGGTTGGVLNPSLVVTGIAPTTGPVGTIITVTGSGFTKTPPVTVLFVRSTGTIVSEDLNPQVISDTQLTVTAPASSGTVDIVLKNSGGVSAKSTADQFTYGTLDTTGGTTGGPPDPPASTGGTP